MGGGGSESATALQNRVITLHIATTVHSTSYCTQYIHTPPPLPPDKHTHHTHTPHLTYVLNLSQWPLRCCVDEGANSSSVRQYLYLLNIYILSNYSSSVILMWDKTRTKKTNVLRSL